LLGRAKLRLAKRLGSGATAGEGVQNMMCAVQGGAALIAVAGGGVGLGRDLRTPRSGAGQLARADTADLARADRWPALPRDAAITDVGGGTSSLALALLRAGYTDITVADISSSSIQRAKPRLGDGADRMTWVQADGRSHDFGRRYELWHDRAVFHFMVDPADRECYLNVLRRTLRAGGHAILPTFGPNGPTGCSGLPVDRYDASKLSQVLAPDFEAVSSRLYDHQTPPTGPPRTSRTRN
jgi:hypothetical protein